MESVLLIHFIIGYPQCYIYIYGVIHMKSQEHQTDNKL